MVKDAEEETARQTEANEKPKAQKRILLPSLNQGTFDVQRHTSLSCFHGRNAKEFETGYFSTFQRHAYVIWFVYILFLFVVQHGKQKEPPNAKLWLAEYVLSSFKSLHVYRSKFQNQIVAREQSQRFANFKLNLKTVCSLGQNSPPSRPSPPVQLLPFEQNTCFWFCATRFDVLEHRHFHVFLFGFVSYPRRFRSLMLSFKLMTRLLRSHIRHKTTANNT